VINGDIEPERLLSFSAQCRHLRTENSADLPDHGFNSITLQLAMSPLNMEFLFASPVI
jgi:hypothetical protein